MMEGTTHSGCNRGRACYSPSMCLPGFNRPFGSKVCFISCIKRFSLAFHNFPFCARKFANLPGHGLRMFSETDPDRMPVRLCRSHQLARNRLQRTFADFLKDSSGTRELIELRNRGGCLWKLRPQ